MNRANRPQLSRISGSSYASRALSRAGDGSTLTLDFTTGVLDPRLTFTRSTSATYIGANGLVKTMAAAPTNDPTKARFDYDPTTLTPRGLLIEASANNLLFWSQDVTQATKWTVQGSPGSYASISATGGTAPDGTNTANLCTEGTGSFSRSIYQSISPAAGAYTASIWAKAGSGSARFVRLVISSDSGNFVYVTVSLANGSITQAATAVGTASAASATVTAYTGSWYKITLTGTLAAALNFVFIVPTDSGAASVNTADYGRYTYTGDGSSFLIWGAQLEAGSGASSYIPTGASTGTRNADSCSMTGTNFSSWFTQGAGTIVAQSDNTKVNGRNLLCQISNAGSTYIQVGNKALAGGGESIGYLLAGSIEGYADSNNNPSLNTAYKSAYVWDTSYFNVCVNGTLATADTSGNVATSGMTQMSIGSDAISPTDSYIKNGHIKSLKYWPTRLSNAQLQSLTT